MSVNGDNTSDEAKPSSSEDSNGRLSNNSKHNDCGKPCAIGFGGARPKVKHLVCNIPNGNTNIPPEDDGKVNNNVHTNSEPESFSPKCGRYFGHLNGIHVNQSNGTSDGNMIDSYIRNNVNFSSSEKFPPKVTNDSEKVKFPSLPCKSNINSAFNGVRIDWGGNNDSSSESGNEGENGHSSDESCIYTYKGDHVADLPMSFFTLDTSKGEVPPVVNGQANGSVERSDIQENSGSSSPDMDFLEMDFDPGPSCEQDSDEDSALDEIPEEAVPPVENIVTEKAESSDTIEGDNSRNDLNSGSSSQNNVQDESPISTLDLPVEPNLTEPVPGPSHEFTATNPVVNSNKTICFACMQRLSVTRTAAAQCWTPRVSWRHHSNSGDLVSPNDSIEKDNVPISVLTSQPKSIVIFHSETYLSSRLNSLQQAFCHCRVYKGPHGREISKMDESDSNLASNYKHIDGFCSPKLLLERVMIWSEQEACNKQVTQISTSACGATAVINAMLALNIPYDLDKLKAGVSTKLRAETAPLPEYLFSRSVAGATHEDIIRGIDIASDGHLFARFFPMYPNKNVELSRWLAYWMRKGAVPIATLNLQQGVSSDCPVPDAWHHQMIFGVGPRGIYFTNPLERLCETEVLPQLCSPSVLLIRRNAVLSRWNEFTDLQPLMCHKDPRWKEMNVLGQVVNLIRESQRSWTPQGRNITRYIAIPAAYSSGITMVISRESPGCEELMFCKW